MLRLLPVEPARIGTSQIKNKLKAQGIDIHVRTIQRDLDSLSKLFDIESDGSKDIPGWYWQRNARKLELPEMEPAVALSFRLVRLFLSKFMPPNTLKELAPYFYNSEHILTHLPDNQLSNWDSKITLMSRNQPLISPTIDPVVLSEIYDALLSEKQIDVIYEPRKGSPSEYSISPRGVVVVDQIIYLVGTLWEYQDIRQFALHRFQSAKTANRENHPLDNTFSLKDYIKEGNFEYIDEEDNAIKLIIKISKGVAKHLSESKLSEDQIITETSNGVILQATTKNTQQLRWWLLGFADGVEVLKPNFLRKEFKELTLQMSQLYSSNK
jgi:predicted DNA-binding transcriptional regulator YafY